MIDYTNPDLAHLTDENLLANAEVIRLGKVIIRERSPKPIAIYLGRDRSRWVVYMAPGALEQYCLNEDGSWRYKRGTAWNTREEALTAYADWLTAHLAAQRAQEAADREADAHRLLWLNDMETA